MRWLLILLLSACAETKNEGARPNDERQIVEVLFSRLKDVDANLVVKEAPARAALTCAERFCGLDPKLWNAFEAARRDGRLPALPDRLQKSVVHDVPGEGYAGPPTLWFSPIGFSGERAIASIGYSCGWMCGEGFTCLLEHDASGWHVVETLARWIS